MRRVRDEIKVNKTDKDRVINEVVDIEWEMFDRVSNQGGRALCQDDEWTFYVMRYSQFNALCEDILNSYRDDLDKSLKEGRNLVMEKYGYMMEFTDPEYYDKKLAPVLPEITPYKSDLIDRIANALIMCEKLFAEAYPRLAAKSRPLIEMGQDTSFHVYAIGELRTYSQRTLRRYHEFLRGIDTRDPGRNPSFLIHETTAAFYGYSSLADAEAKA